MRVLLQRVTSGSVGVGGNTVGRISHGLVMLVGVGQGDTLKEADKLAQKSAELRIFNDDQGRFNRSLLDMQGGALVVSQFTLYADSRRGRRPNFTGAASPQQASVLIDRFAECLCEQGVDPVARGVFGANMAVEIHNDGPVTIWLDSDDL